ncbi:MAG TPA: D-aminoacylase [Vicinamibacteria bacterium]|nr:D-aminoacylase [Vicinamibacteria bacterium]
MSLRHLAVALLAAAAGGALGAAPAPPLTIIRGGTVYDGSGRPPRRADVALRGDRVVEVGDLARRQAAVVIDAAGLAVAPGFVNMLSWSTESLLVDGRSQGEIRQGVTTQIFGEGWSMGPLTEPMKQRMKEQQGDLRFEVAWTTLGEYLRHLQKRGVAPNVASFIGAATIREHVVGLEDRPPTPAELDKMRDLVRREMEAGALGIGSSLIYAPGSYASTEELIELSKVAARHGGTYISHMRSEGERLLEAVDEVVRISREAGLPAEIYHLKAAGEANWPKMDAVIARVERARAEGLQVRADMYTYTAGATGFDACIPRWALSGGIEALFPRLQDAATRARIASEMAAPGMGFENLCLLAGSPERILLVGFKTDALKPLTGRTLAQVAQERGTDPWQTILDLVAADRTRIEVVFFLMSEDNVRKQIKLPWVAFGSDAGSMAPEPPFTLSSAHPRAYGNFARLLGRYVRDEKLIPLEEAVRRLTSMPAANLGLKERGLLAPGMYADVVVFDPATIADRATYERPHQYATGVRHVFVNGVQVLKDGEHTGALPGRALSGRGAAARAR